MSQVPPLSPREPDSVQFGLRQLLIMIAVCCVIFAFMRYIMPYWPKGMPVWVAVVYGVWTAAAIFNIAAISSTLNPMLVEVREDRRKVISRSIAWSVLPIVQWVLVTIALLLHFKRITYESLWLRFFAVAALHLVPLSALQFCRSMTSARRGEGAHLWMLQLSTALNAAIPAVAAAVGLLAMLF